MKYCSKLTIKTTERRHCAKVSFLIKLQAEAYDFIKNETLTQRRGSVIFIVNFEHVIGGWDISQCLLSLVKSSTI